MTPRYMPSVSCGCCFLIVWYRLYRPGAKKAHGHRRPPIRETSAAMPKPISLAQRIEEVGREIKLRESAFQSYGRARALQAWLGHRNIQHTVRYTLRAERTEVARESLSRVLAVTRRSWLECAIQQHTH